MGRPPNGSSSKGCKGGRKGGRKEKGEEAREEEGMKEGGEEKATRVLTFAAYFRLDSPATVETIRLALDNPLVYKRPTV